MNVVFESQHSLLLQTLFRFENESLLIQNRNALVKLFCIQIIPFLFQHSLLQPLWKELREQYEELNAQVVEYERNAIHEIKKAFKEIQRDLKSRQAIPKDTETQIEEARPMLST
jgi:hypothetical protein